LRHGKKIIRNQTHSNSKEYVSMSVLERGRLLTPHNTAMGLPMVKLALLQREAQEIQQGVISVLDDNVSHSVLISMGLDLEDQQCVAICPNTC
jgi:hypothetical protein